MNARTIRRAIERKALKQANKEIVKDTGVGVDADRTISELQHLINRRNAAHSTGPTSPEGKAKSSKNALTTGLTGRTVLLADEDATRYEHHLQSVFHDLQPAGDRETELAQSIADSKWRLARIPSLEFGIYALGRIQFAEEFQTLPKAEATALIEARTFLAYQRQLNNLSIQENRLRRQCEKDSAELTRLQTLRAAAEKAPSVSASKPSPPIENGFEFETNTLDLLEDQLSRESTLFQLRPAA